jgi:hypothetical protein
MIKECSPENVVHQIQCTIKCLNLIIIWKNLKKCFSDNCFEYLADSIFLLFVCVIAGQGFSHYKARELVYLDSIFYVVTIMSCNLCFKCP